jgi:flagellar motor switch protein FliG
MNVEKAAQILALLNKQSSHRILDFITSQDPALAREIRSNLLNFEDLSKLSDRDLKILLREVPNPLLTLALKGVDRLLVEKIVNNLSKRVGAILQEELAMQGPKPRTEVHTAQKTIIAITRLLVDQGKIFTPWLDSGDKVIY